MSNETPARKPYPSDLTDAQWTILEPLIPAAHTQHGGRPREVDMREVVSRTADEYRAQADAAGLALHVRLPDDGPFPDAARPKKTNLGAELILLVARRFPHLKFRVLADHLYNGRSVLHAVLSEVDNVHIVTRGRPDAALYEMPPKRQPGQIGRPKTKGDRLVNPREWAEEHPEAFREATVDIYGRTVTVQVASYLGMAYRSLPGRLVRYVIVKDPSGVYRTDYLISTDPDLAEAAVVEAYSRRWPLERAFQDCKQKLCVENTQTQLPTSDLRSVPFGMAIYTMVVLWYVTEGHAEAASLAPRISDPWYVREV
jgi:hypothetical protein